MSRRVSKIPITTTRAKWLRLETIDPTVEGSGGRKKARVELGLALLELVAKPGRGLSQHDIALWCGCSIGAIYLIERRARKKLANKLFFGPHRAFFQELLRTS